MDRRIGWGRGWAIREEGESGRIKVVRLDHPRLVVELVETPEELWDIHSIELLDDVSLEVAREFVEESFEIFFRWLLEREGRDLID